MADKIKNRKDQFATCPLSIQPTPSREPLEELNTIAAQSTQCNKAKIGSN